MAKTATKPAKKTASAQAKKAARSAKSAAHAPPPMLMPHIVCKGAVKAIDFYKKAFGAQEQIRLPGPDGKLIHAAVKIGSAIVMMVDENPQWGAKSPKALGGTPITIHLMVDDVDSFVKRAVKAGATEVMPVADMFWGDRYGVIEDPFGHRWSIATHQRDLTKKEIIEAMNCAMGAPGK